MTTEPIKPKKATTGSRKRRGRETEHMVARFMAARGWPSALATGAGTPGRDITGAPGLAPEVKARTGFKPLAALRQAVKNSKGDIPFVVMRPDGCGETSIEEWPAFLPFEALLTLLREAGYGGEGRPEYPPLPTYEEWRAKHGLDGAAL